MSKKKNPGGKKPPRQPVNILNCWSTLLHLCSMWKFVNYPHFYTDQKTPIPEWQLYSREYQGSTVYGIQIDHQTSMLQCQSRLCLPACFTLHFLMFPFGCLGCSCTKEVKSWWKSVPCYKTGCEEGCCYANAQQGWQMEQAKVTTNHVVFLFLFQPCFHLNKLLWTGKQWFS